MNPSFYPKHLARQYAQSGGSLGTNKELHQFQNRPWAQVYPLHGGLNSHENSNKDQHNHQKQQVVEGQVQVMQIRNSYQQHQLVEPSASHHRSGDEVISSTGNGGAITGGKMQVPKNSAVFSGLPSAFIQAMRKLFDMVDVRGEGKVKMEGAAHSNLIHS